MQEVFEKIIEKLEEKIKNEEQKSIKADIDETIYLKTALNAMADRYRYAIEIVKQAAAEYEQCYKDCTECEAYNKEKHHCPKFCHVITEAVKEIEENHNGWIPCSDHLPKENGYYYVTQIVKSISTGEKIAIEKAYVEFSGGKWRRAKHLEVIAWLDIEPYQPKGE